MTPSTRAWSRRYSYKIPASTTTLELLPYCCRREAMTELAARTLLNEIARRKKKPCRSVPVIAERAAHV